MNKWESIQVPETIKKELIKQILKGTINREQFPELWPPELLGIQVILPKDENT